jgi:hypothetical protein
MEKIEDRTNGSNGGAALYDYLIGEARCHLTYWPEIKKERSK